MGFKFGSCALVYALFAFLLAALSPALSQNKGAIRQLPSRNAPPPLAVMYVSDASTSAINVFRLDDGQQVASIPYPMGSGGTSFGGGAGLATDTQNNLYAGYVFDNGNNYPGKTVIFGYAPGQIHWFTKIDGGCCTAPNLAISNRGEIAEALEGSGSCCSGGVGFIEPGKKFVGRGNGALSSVPWEAYDAEGTLWIDGYNQRNKPRIGVITPGSRAFQPVTLNPAASIGPLAVDPANNVLVDNDSNLYAYNRQGTLAYSVTLTGASQVVAMALSRDAKTLFVAEAGGTVLAYNFPAGGAKIKTYAVGGAPFAMALGSI